MSTPRTARDRARQEITAEILSAARARLASGGPTELSLRAVARDVGMVSSAVYRYFPSRDELLTALLVGAYDELGAAAEAADDQVADRDDVRARWMAVCRGVRAWALAHPHDYALLYGTPVIGYAAPQDTVAPAIRVVARLVGVVADAHRLGAREPAAPAQSPDGFAGSFRSAVPAIRDAVGIDLDTSPEVVGRTLMGWSSIFGAISFELWGHLAGSVDDTEVYFDGLVARLWHDLGGL